MLPNSTCGLLGQERRTRLPALASEHVLFAMEPGLFYSKSLHSFLLIFLDICRIICSVHSSSSGDFGSSHLLTTGKLSLLVKMHQYNAASYTKKYTGDR